MTYRIGVDLDGVCYNFVAALREYICETTGRDIAEMPDAESWNFFRDQWGYSVDEYLELAAAGINDLRVFWRGDPIPGSVEAITQLYREGYEIVIVTSREFPNTGRMGLLATQYWLSHVGIPYHELHVTNDKTNYNLDVLIDDSPGNLQAFSEKSLRAVAFHQRWNSHLEDQERVNDWPHALEFIHENFPINRAKSSTAG